LHFHFGRTPELNRTEEASLSNGSELLNKREQNRSSFSMSKGAENLNRREQNRTEQKQLAFPLGQNA
jgi:hypothetical protein